MRRKVSKIKDIDTLILFGGGPLLVNCAKFAGKRKMKTYVFAVKRHLNEIIDYERRLTFKAILRKEKIPYFLVQDINQSSELKSLISKNSIGIGFGEAYTFAQNTIDLFKGKLFDFMVIKLPQYRGGAHFTWQILRNDRTGCWNIQLINKEMVPGVYDSGEILKTKEYAIPNWARIPADYFGIASVEGMKIFKEFMSDIRAGKEFKLKKLSENNSSYYPRLFTLKHGFINWFWNTDEIERFICAFDEPYMGASTFLNNKKVFLKDCRIGKKGIKSHPFMSGLIYRIYENKIFIFCKDGAIIVKKILNDKGKNIIPYLKVGQRFYTPYRNLQEAMLFQADYNSEGLINKIRK